MMSKSEWEEAKECYPVGSEAAGRVTANYPFGVFLRLDRAPHVNAFMDVVSYNPESDADSPVPLPAVGDRVIGFVADLAERDRQIRVRVGLPFWEKEPGI